LRQELDLGLAEIDQRVDSTLELLEVRVDGLKGDLARAAMTGAVFFASGLFALAGIAFLLARVMPGWAACFVVAATAAIAALMLGHRLVGDTRGAISSVERVAKSAARELRRDYSE
jgi:hypothetical protein